MSPPRQKNLAPLTIALAIVSGCASKPMQANITLRKEQRSLNDRIDVLNRQHDADAASIAAYQKSNGSLQTLSQANLDQLFTTHGIKLNRLTGGIETDDAKVGDDALKIYFVPTDEQNQPLKAVGEVTVEAFGDDAKQPLQQWKFTRQQVKAAWLGDALLYEFVLICPFEKHPSQAKLNVRVTFVDALTGRQFSADKSITIKPG